MGRVAPPADEPSNRWPWIALFGGVIIVVLAVVIFFFNRSGNSSVNISVSGTPSPVAAVSSVSPGPPPTLVPPTLLPSASLAPTATSVPSPSATLAPPTPLPSPTPAPPPPTPAPAIAAASPSSAAPAAQAAPAAPPTPVAAQGAPAQASAVAPATQAPSPTPFAGQVSAGGGLGNTRSDIDAAYGAPSGQTPNGLVVFRKNTFEYHVGLVPDLNGRASVIVVSPVQAAQLPALQQAQSEAHRLLPRDAQPPNPSAEGNNQFVVERYTSQSLAQALPAQLFSPGGGQAGAFLVVYVKDASGNIARWILGPGNDPNTLIAEGG